MVRIVKVNDDYWRYVSLCTHIDEINPELVKASKMRLTWLKERAKAEGLVVKVALNDEGKALGFIHFAPIESFLSQMIGSELMVILCLTINYQLVYNRVQGTGVGRLLVQSCEDKAKQNGFKGLAVYAYSGDFWFMPSAFFQKLGFTRVSKTSEIWIKTWGDVKDPTSFRKNYEYHPVSGKVVIDYFWSPFCLTVCVEIGNIRKVTSEFGEKVILREYRSDDPEVFKKYGLFRALFINGHRKNWGYAAPKEELRKEIMKFTEP
jgi:GNAT superfamily N-acetyltransferase